MSDHGRKRGDKTSYPICVWNGVFDHCEKIGIALWEFLWLIDAVTEEQDGIGWVFGKAPFKIERIAKDLGLAPSTVRRNFDRLKSGGYILTRRARYGIIVGVLNSRKMRPQNRIPDRSKVSELESSSLKSEHTDCSEVSGLATSILMDNSNRQRRAATAVLQSLWKLLGSDLPMGSPRFQKIAEHYFAARNGNTLSDAMERAIQAANKRSVGVPPKFFDAKRDIERREREKSATTDTERPELEAIPWRTK